MHFENDFKHILWILEKSEIPLIAQERYKVSNEGNAKFPLIIGGGPVVTSNPKPFSTIFDILFIGDAEPNLKLFFKIYQAYKKENIEYREFLETLGLIEGIYIPTLNMKTRRATLKNLDDSPTPTIQMITKSSDEKSIFESNFLVEINRGCPYQCKFCISSFHNFPFRNRSFKNIKQSVEDGIKFSNFETISLIGSCVSSHPKFKQICELIIMEKD